MYVYFIRTSDKPIRVKVGKSQDPDGRLQTLQTGCPSPLVMIGVIKCNSDHHSSQVERAIHEVFSPFRLGGEWFKYSFIVSKAIHRLLYNGEEALTRFFVSSANQNAWRGQLQGMGFEIAAARKANLEARDSAKSRFTSKRGEKQDS